MQGLQMLSYHPTAKTTVNIRKEIKENKDKFKYTFEELNLKNRLF